MFGTIALALIAIVSFASPLFAQVTSPQPTKIFVASTGNDANDGGRASPKRSFQAAHNAVAAGGNIVVLDTAGYGALAITKSIAVTVPPGVNGFITISGSATGVTVDAGADGVVSLQGLIVEGGGTSGGTGIRIVTAKSVAIDDCLIRNLSTGIKGEATTTTRTEVHRTTIRQVSFGVLMTTVNLIPFDAKLVDVVVSDATSYAYYAGNTTGSSPLSFMYLSRCEASGSFFGLSVSAKTQAVIDECKFSSNDTAFNKSFDSGIIYTLNNNSIVFNKNYINGSNTLDSIPLR